MNLIDICVDATYDSGCFNEQQNQMTTYVYSRSTDYTSDWKISEKWKWMAIIW